ncbi:hypothetical protein J6590_029834 [Homalodisca vitripennis]|nr:hypothetical protein J6590_029834 [Homalodisca vitripennis]
MYLGYESRVYCDGSHVVTTFMTMQISFGVQRIATLFDTVTDHMFGFDGVETYFQYRCSNWGDDFEPFVFGTTFTYHPVPLSFLRNVIDVVETQGLPEQDFYIVPMRLPHRCVTEPECVPPPNPYFNKLPETPFVPPDPFVDELPIAPLPRLDVILNDIAEIYLDPPDIVCDEPPIQSFPLVQPFVEDVPNILIPSPDLVFDERPVIPLPDPFVKDIRLPGIPIPLSGSVFDNNIPVPFSLPDPLLNEIAPFPPYHHPPLGPLFNDMAKPFINKPPSLVVPPPKPFFNTLTGKSRPSSHSVFNELHSVSLL